VGGTRSPHLYHAQLHAGKATLSPISPQDGVQSHWVTMLQFKSHETADIDYAVGRHAGIGTSPTEGMERGSQ